MATVLVVDDESDIVKLVQAIVTRDGHTVITAASGESAIEKARASERQPDLLITDVVMPGLSGPMVADQLKQEFPKLKVLFISAFDDRQVVRSYVKKPGHELVAKPFRVDEFADKVRSLLAAGDGAARTDS